MSFVLLIIYNFSQENIVIPTGENMQGYRIDKKDFASLNIRKSRINQLGSLEITLDIPFEFLKPSRTREVSFSFFHSLYSISSVRVTLNHRY